MGGGVRVAAAVAVKVGVAVGVGKCVLVAVRVGVWVHVGVLVRVYVAVAVGIGVGVSVGDGTTEPHSAWTESRFGVPKHGSPKTLLSANTVHAGFPTQALATLLTEFASLQVPRVNAPHTPPGVL